MAIEDNKYLVFSLGNELYGIPILKIKSIEKKMDITWIPRTPDFVKGITNLRGKIVPILDLKQKFNIGAADNSIRSCIIIVEVIIDSVNQINGLIVDEVSEVLDISEGYIEPVPKYGGNTIDQAFMSGIAKIKDKVVILLDIQKILENSQPGVVAEK